VRIDILQDRRLNRPNGDGHVYFKTMEEVDEAMKCNRKYMGKDNLFLLGKNKWNCLFSIFLGSRYIELYFDSLRPSSSNHRRSKSNDSPHHSSRSLSQTKTNDNSRSRSMFLFFSIKTKTTIVNIPR
jgi:hypothetical protein